MNGWHQVRVERRDEDQQDGRMVVDVIKPAEPMLFADCGTRPRIGGAGIEDNQVLAYSSHWSNIGMTEGGTLYHTYLASWLRDKIPLLRHGGQRSGGSYRNAGINVVFCDGHAEWVGLQDFRKVRISPYEY